MALRTMFRSTALLAVTAATLAACVAPAPGVSDAYPGDVAPGHVRWGSSIGGNGSPDRHETSTAKNLGLRRTFFSWEQRTGSMIRHARTDVAGARVPWVSIKPPTDAGTNPWKVLASGARDAQIDEMLRALDAVGGPVWFTVHHEPEGGNGTPHPDAGAGTEKDWRAMQIKIRARMTAVGTRNIAFAPILMAWTFDKRSGRNPADWWVDGIWDFAGIDHYIEADATTMETTMWLNTRAYYTAKGLDIAIGEWGNKDHGPSGAAEMQAWYDTAIRSGSSGQAQIVGQAYFDTDLNGGVPLSGAVLAKFRQLVDAPTSISAGQR